MDESDDAITVTSATQSEAEMRESLGVPAAAPEAAPVPDEAGAEQEADSPKTDAEVSEAARTLRRSRSEKKVLKEIALRKQAEERAERAERALAAAAAPPPPPPAATRAADAAPAAASSAAPPFTFPTFDEFQTHHPEADYDAYQDARSDARDVWRAGVRWTQQQQRFEALRQEEAKRAADRRVADFTAHEKGFIEAHPDYHEVLERVPLTVTDEQGRTFTPPTVKSIQDLLFRTGEGGPQVLYYLGQHPDDAARLLGSRSPVDLIRTYTQIELKALGSSSTPSTPASAPRPSRPISDAPAPLEAVPGGAHHIPSLQALADDTEDADAYIARRRQDERTRRTG